MSSTNFPRSPPVDRPTGVFSTVIGNALSPSSESFTSVLAFLVEGRQRRKLPVGFLGPVEGGMVPSTGFSLGVLFAPEPGLICSRSTSWISVRVK